LPAPSLCDQAQLRPGGRTIPTMEKRLGFQDLASHPALRHRSRSYLVSPLRASARVVRSPVSRVGAGWRTRCSFERRWLVRHRSRYGHLGRLALRCSGASVRCPSKDRSHRRPGLVGPQIPSECQVGRIGIASRGPHTGAADSQPGGLTGGRRGCRVALRWPGPARACDGLTHRVARCKARHRCRDFAV
jgi:hypothetical protein